MNLKDTLMLDIKKHYQKYKRNQTRKEIRDRLKIIEEERTTNNTWSASIEVNIQLLSELRADLLLVSGSDYSSIYLNTGFSNVVHLFNWTNAIIDILKNRDIVGYEMTHIVYERKSIKLNDFLLTSKQKRYPVDALYINLLSELKTIIHHLNAIKDPKYYDRSYAALDPIWVDVFAIVEMLCNLGVTNE